VQEGPQPVDLLAQPLVLLAGVRRQQFPFLRAQGCGLLEIARIDRRVLGSPELAQSCRGSATVPDPAPATSRGHHALTRILPAACVAAPLLIQLDEHPSGSEFAKAPDWHWWDRYPAA
jgi:hypothetical protein